MVPDIETKCADLIERQGRGRDRERSEEPRNQNTEVKGKERKERKGEKREGGVKGKKEGRRERGNRKEGGEEGERGKERKKKGGEKEEEKGRRRKRRRDLANCREEKSWSRHRRGTCRRKLYKRIVISQRPSITRPAMDSKAPSVDSYVSAMLLSAAGDALGYRNQLWEFCKSGAQIHKELSDLGGLQKINASLPDWPVSDDTVLHLATAESLATGKLDEELYHELATRYVSAMSDMEGRKPGPTSILGKLSAPPTMQDKAAGSL
ncbi:uncharacterized protein [Pyxicephalus adspersus]|uniref:uncharacterized protein n=1 Tax=Pyxicephalus adspersus TaxID=30357 RepID=UPI003B5A0D3F